MFDPWVRRSPGGGHGNPLQYSCLGESPGQRSLAGHSPQGLTESDMTEATEHVCNVEPIYFLHQYDGSNISTSLSSLRLISVAVIFCLFFIVAILVHVKWYLILVLTCISLMINAIEHLFMCLLAFCTSFLKKCLFKPFAHLHRFILFCCYVLRVLYIFWI